VELVVVLLAVAGALRLLAGRINVPYPVLFVLGGLGLALVPGLPRPAIDPDTLFLIFIPPLLYWAALTTSLRDFRRQIWPIARYGTLVVLLTMAAVAVVAHALSSDLGWPAAFLLGAIVSPPDPVAAIAILRPLGAPRTLVTILEGEGLVNDATALVAYRVAVTAVVTGTFSLGAAATRLALTGAGGVVIGLAIGWLIGVVRRRLRPFPIVENTLSLLTPFIVYIPADGLGLSGVLAVVAVGLYLGHIEPLIVSPATRVQAEGIWTLLQFLLESTIFILIGLDLPYLHGALGHYPLSFLLTMGGAVALTCVVVRIAYTFVAAWILRMNRRRRGRELWPRWSEATFIGWTGMRGGDSLVIALALPAVTAQGGAFPGRDLIIFTTFCVIFATLVLQGFTVVPLLRLLGLHADSSADVEEAHARRVAAEVGLERLDRTAADDHPERAAIDYLRERYRRKCAGGPHAIGRITARPMWSIEDSISPPLAGRRMAANRRRLCIVRCATPCSTTSGGPWFVCATTARSATTSCAGFSATSIWNRC
jgi:CPA1 family monovalent cation:H+ antiporter